LEINQTVREELGEEGLVETLQELEHEIESPRLVRLDLTAICKSAFSHPAAKELVFVL
jgi:hypothetical protein